MKKLLFILILIIAIALRLFKFGTNPPSLYWDEASLGYNAYLIATSGHDEHGEFLPLSRFIAFGDYKPPGYIYSTVPSILLFGLNEFSVRLPSLIAGFLMIVITYLLVKELFGNEILSLLSSFLLSISPWAIQFSRAAFEANLAAFFNLMGIYLFLIGRKKGWYIIPSVIFFVLSFYTFNANRIIAPLLLLGLVSLYFKDIWSNKKYFLISAVLALILLLPSLNYIRSRESRLRLQEVSIFNNLEPIKLSNQRIGLDADVWWAKIIHNRRILFLSDFLKHYFDNFSGRFLFTHGDVNPRLNAQEMGQLYVWELPFLLVGIYWLIKKKEKALPILSLWMLVVPIPAATARETPHALRILSILPTFQIITAYGLYQLVFNIKKKFLNSSTIGGALRFAQDHPRGVLAASPSRSRLATPGRWPIIAAVICLLLSVNIYYYLHNYYIHYPSNWSGEWQYGYKQMVAEVLRLADNYDQIFVTDALGRPYIYFAFYGKYPYDDFQKGRKASRDWFGFWNVEALGKIQFSLNKLRNAEGRVLLVTTPGNLPGNFRLINSIKNLSGQDVFSIAEGI
ncbi:glycosyltransferase family 39 protein [Candidatus Gottesmanbacteria bacterium]|nr:glycosyltransferase family 39 protein [Candidatus Gottesmanbacteria bacterium]